MQAYILLGALIGLPFVLGLAFRVATPHLFLALLSGELLQRYFTDDAQLVLGSFIRNESVLEYTGLAILILPMVLTAVFLHHTLSKGKTILHALPLIITGIVFAAFASELLPDSLYSQLENNRYGHILVDATDVIIGGMIFLQLITLWLFNRSHGKKH